MMDTKMIKTQSGTWEVQSQQEDGGGTQENM